VTVEVMVTSTVITTRSVPNQARDLRLSLGRFNLLVCYEALLPSDYHAAVSVEFVPVNMSA
jgi:hypothetical protein